MLKFLVLTSRGIENLLMQELDDLGVQVKKETIGGVWIDCDQRMAYKICLWSRLATRVLLLQAEGEVNNAEDLYSIAQRIDWPAQFSTKNAFVVDFSGTNNTVRNSQFGALKIKDAVVDQFYDENGHRPDISKDNPDFRVVARLRNSLLQVFIDFSGPSLSMRGYRQEQGLAPLKEHVAAALIIRSAWDKSQPFYDIFCGAGTILIEAAMLAFNIAPGIKREQFGFRNWLGHRDALWTELKEEAEQAIVQDQSNLIIRGFDIDGSVLRKAKMNVSRAGLSDVITLENRSAVDAMPENGDEKGMIVSNPPYGERLGEMPELAALFADLGIRLKEYFVDWKLAMLSQDAQLLSGIKISRNKQYKLKNGPLDCIFNLYEITEKQAHQSVVTADSDFCNRVRKNMKALQKWVKKDEIEAYRLYDADLPEYNVAVDVYQGYAVVQEYAPPKTVDPAKAHKRLLHVLAVMPLLLDIPSTNVIYKVRKQQKGKSQYETLNKKELNLVINEYGAKLRVNLTDYLDTGLFLDHRTTRQIVAQKAKGKDFLNLFAYTGSVSVHAACHGAKSVTTVDMSNTYLAWAKENFELNKLAGKQYEFIAADCLKWIQHTHEQFDLIFVDPPTFSNSKKMEDSFDVQRDHAEMLIGLKKALKPGGEIIFTNNKRGFKIDESILADEGLKVVSMSQKTLPLDYKRNPKIHNSWSITVNE